MEIKRAIEILDPEHRERYEDLEEVNEACRMGMEALRIVQKTGEMCEHLTGCTGDSCPIHWPEE